MGKISHYRLSQCMDLDESISFELHHPSQLFCNSGLSDTFVNAVRPENSHLRPFHWGPVDDPGPLAQILARKPRPSGLYPDDLDIAEVLEPEDIADLQAFEIATADIEPAARCNLPQAAVNCRV